MGVMNKSATSAAMTPIIESIPKFLNCSHTEVVNVANTADVMSEDVMIAVPTTWNVFFIAGR